MIYFRIQICIYIRADLTIHTYVHTSGQKKLSGLHVLSKTMLCASMVNNKSDAFKNKIMKTTNQMANKRDTAIFRPFIQGKCHKSWHSGADGGGSAGRRRESVVVGSWRETDETWEPRSIRKAAKILSTKQ